VQLLVAVHPVQVGAAVLGVLEDRGATSIAPTWDR
jgi:hypothetical protein